MSKISRGSTIRYAGLAAFLILGACGEKGGNAQKGKSSSASDDTLEDDNKGDTKVIPTPDGTLVTGTGGDDPAGPAATTPSPTPAHRVAWDFNGDGKSDFAKFWKDGTDWTADVHTSTGASFNIARWATHQGGYFDGMQWFVGDFNGDGKSDFAKFWADDNQWSSDVHLSNGTSFNMTRWATKQGAQSDLIHWITGDFNGDGKTDFVSYWDDGGSMSSDVHLSNGSAFTTAHWATKQGGIFDGMTWVAADFNGDGKTDIAKYWNDDNQWSIDVHLSTGYSFNMARWATKQGGLPADMQWVVGDFNGDGKADFASFWNNGGSWSSDVHLSTGSSFTSSRWATKQGGYPASMHWVAGDFNGDGKTDLASWWNDGGSWSSDVHLSNGASFAIARWATQQGGYSDSQHWTTGDFDGDGKTDFASYWKDADQWTSDVHLSTGSTFGIKRWATNLGGMIDSMRWYPVAN